MSNINRNITHLLCVNIILKKEEKIMKKKLTKKVSENYSKVITLKKYDECK